MTASEPLDPAAIRARYGADLGAGMERVVRLEYLGEQAREDVPALLDLVEQQAAEIERLRVVLAAVVEYRDQFAAERDEARAEAERLRTDRDRMHLALARERHERAEAAEWPEDAFERQEVVTIVPDLSVWHAAMQRVRDVIECSDASRAPESPADPAAPRATPNTR